MSNTYPALHNAMWPERAPDHPTAAAARVSGCETSDVSLTDDANLPIRRPYPRRCSCPPGDGRKANDEGRRRMSRRGRDQMI